MSFTDTDHRRHFWMMLGTMVGHVRRHGALPGDRQSGVTTTRRRFPDGGALSVWRLDSRLERLVASSIVL